MHRANHVPILMLTFNYLLTALIHGDTRILTGMVILIKKWTTTYRHNLTIDGGARGMTYYVSLGLKGDESFYKQSTTSYKQYNVRAKVDMPINDWLKTGIDVAGFHEYRVLIPIRAQMLL